MEGSVEGSPERIERLVPRLFVQLTKGCGRSTCTNKEFCATAGTPIPPNKAAARALTITLNAKSEAEMLCDEGDAMEVVTPIEESNTLDVLMFEAEVAEATLNDNFTPVIRQIGKVCSLPECLNKSFLAGPSASDEDPGLDFEAVHRFFAIVKQYDNLVNALANATKNLLANAKYSPPRSIEDLRLFIIVPLNPLWIDFEHHKNVVAPYITLVDGLREEYKDVLVSWWAELKPNLLDAVVNLLQMFITTRALDPEIRFGMEQPRDIHQDALLPASIRVLELLYKANERSGVLRYTVFYNDTLNESLREHYMSEELRNWMRERGFAYCNYPFVLNPETKSHVLRYESMMQQEMESINDLRSSIFAGIINRGTLGRLIFRVRRDHLVPDTMNEIARHDPSELRKRLKVQFVGEDGIDEGGVQKEFFQLIVREIFNPDYGMFVHNKETETYWFNGASFELADFRLIGTMLGVAIYNDVILDVHFPQVIYNKLTGKTPALQDLYSVKPALANGLQQLLDMEGDVEELLGEVFQVTYEEFGEKKVKDLVKDGGTIPVTRENREEYVRLYVKFLLEESVEKQFAAFEEGFRSLCSSAFFRTFRAEELELVICGSPVFDFEELEKSTEYDGGYSADHPVIRNFWSVVHSFTHEQQKQLLFFSTGSDRSPIGGLKNLTFVILRHGPDSDRLPTAHTCFNHLMLPEYSSVEKLRDRLLSAISNAEGFGML